ncbi:MAG TPA: glycosyltransferase family 2 protein [Rhodocyclaceae bacterium]|jgi:glycosyltransferase involved in cell wall biosynthesis
MTVLISICIPTYNGEKVLPETLDSILGQILDGMEVILCDDGSSDRTLEIAQRYEASHHQVKVFQNPCNLGMDRNFAQSVQHSTGKYVWFSGQDDIFEPGAVAKVFQVLNQRPDLGMIYLNYRFLSGDLSRTVAPPLLDMSADQVFHGAAEYFKAIDHAPSFLPATVMRRNFWDKVPIDQFFGTHYVQVAVWLYNARDSEIYVIASPDFISCRMPEESWKFTGGKMLFEIFTGKFFVYKTIHLLGDDYVPARISNWFENDYFHRYFRKLVVLKSMGLEVTSEHRRRVRAVAHGPFHFYCCLLPALLVPNWLASAIMRVHSWIRRRDPGATQPLVY